MKICVKHLRQLIKEELLIEATLVPISEKGVRERYSTAYAELGAFDGRFEEYGRYLIFRPSDATKRSKIWIDRPATVKPAADLPKMVDPELRRWKPGRTAYGTAAATKALQMQQRQSAPPNVVKPAEPYKWRTYSQLNREQREDLIWLDARDRAGREEVLAAEVPSERPSVSGRAGYSPGHIRALKRASTPTMGDLMSMPMDKLMNLFSMAGKKKSGGETAKWQRIQDLIGKAIRQKAYEEAGE